MANYFFYIREKYPDLVGGAISSLNDGTIRWFYGFGKNECRGSGSVSGDLFAQGLADVRDRYFGPNIGSYFVTGSDHVLMIGSSLYRTEVQGTVLSEWVSDLIDFRPTHIEP